MDHLREAVALAQSQVSDGLDTILRCLREDFELPLSSTFIENMNKKLMELYYLTEGGKWSREFASRRTQFIDSCDTYK